MVGNSAGLVDMYSKTKAKTALFTLIINYN